MKDWLKLKKLERELETIEKKHSAFQQSEKYKKMSPEGKSNEDDAYIACEYFPLRDEIEDIRSRMFLKKARKLGIPYPKYYDKACEEFWTQSGFGFHYLTDKGYHEIRKAMREEKKARREAVLCWAPLITVLTGLLGVIATVLSILRYWGK